MPAYNFQCCKCRKKMKRLMEVEEYKALQPPDAITCECGYTARRVRQASTSQTKEVLDNGLMARPLERMADAERIFQERAAAHDQKYGEKDPDQDA